MGLNVGPKVGHLLCDPPQTKATETSPYPVGELAEGVEVDRVALNSFSLKPLSFGAHKREPSRQLPLTLAQVIGTAEVGQDFGEDVAEASGFTRAAVNIAAEQRRAVGNLASIGG